MCFEERSDSELLTDLILLLLAANGDGDHRDADHVEETMWRTSSYYVVLTTFKKLLI